MMRYIALRCPTCRRVTRLPVGNASWGCCGVTYTAHEAEDGMVSVHWAEGERSDLLLAARCEVTIPPQKHVAPLRRGRPAKKPASAS